MLPKKSNILIRHKDMKLLKTDKKKRTTLISL